MQFEDQEAVPPEWASEIARVLIGPSNLSNRISHLALQLSKDYAGLDPVFVVVLKGSFMFAADLSRAMSIPHTLEFIRAKSYQGMESTGHVQVQGIDDVDLKGRHVLLIEDIVDTGITLKGLYHNFEGRGAQSIKCCSLLEKETVRRKEDVPALDYVAFNIPDEFVVGYGLDLDQRLRHLPFVGIYKHQ